ncbi:MAG: hypothetical protein LBL04_02075 [Bacteroidales bacterium]|nr:hypothetical protein [Bacteroidales bacterium]
MKPKKAYAKPEFRRLTNTGELIERLAELPGNTAIVRFTIELVDKQLYPIKIEQK